MEFKQLNLRETCQVLVSAELLVALTAALFAMPSPMEVEIQPDGLSTNIAPDLTAGPQEHAPSATGSSSSSAAAVATAAASHAKHPPPDPGAAAAAPPRETPTPWVFLAIFAAALIWLFVLPVVRAWWNRRAFERVRPRTAAARTAAAEADATARAATEAARRARVAAQQAALNDALVESAALARKRSEAAARVPKALPLAHSLGADVATTPWDVHRAGALEARKTAARKAAIDAAAERDAAVRVAAPQPTAADIPAASPWSVRPAAETARAQALRARADDDAAASDAATRAAAPHPAAADLPSAAPWRVRTADEVAAERANAAAVAVAAAPREAVWVPPAVRRRAASERAAADAALALQMQREMFGDQIDSPTLPPSPAEVIAQVDAAYEKSRAVDAERAAERLARAEAERRAAEVERSVVEQRNARLLFAAAELTRELARTSIVVPPLTGADLEQRDDSDDAQVFYSFVLLCDYILHYYNAVI